MNLPLVDASGFGFSHGAGIRSRRKSASSVLLPKDDVQIVALITGDLRTELKDRIGICIDWMEDKPVRSAEPAVGWRTLA